jgi:hypothetical protein
MSKDLLNDIYGASKAPHLKASDNEGYNQIVTIKAAAIDELTFPGEPLKKMIIIDIGEEKPIALSRTIACGHFPRRRRGGSAISIGIESGQQSGVGSRNSAATPTAPGE